MQIIIDVTLVSGAFVVGVFVGATLMLVSSIIFGKDVAELKTDD